MRFVHLKENMKNSLAKLLFILLLLLIAQGCKRKEPEYVLKSENGEQAVAHFDQMEDQPKYLRVKKTQWERAQDLERKKEARDKSRRLYYGKPGTKSAALP